MRVMQMRALLLLPLALLLGSCRTSGTQTDNGGLLASTAGHGLIAYVAEDGNVSVIDRDGGSWRAVTNDAALHAFKLTILIALVAVPANTIFGSQWAWSTEPRPTSW